MRVSKTLVGVCAVLLGSGVTGPTAAEAAEGTPTFTKDVAPILYENCASCHRPNHLAPMSLITYDEARPWARAVKAKVLAGEMPPWGADSSLRAYRNDASLSQTEIDTIAAWVDGGALEGSDADLPDVPEFAEGWSIGEPDVIFTMLEPFRVPADGTVPYSYVTIPTNLAEDTWISAHEFRPGDRRVLHHVIPFVLEDDGKPATAEVRSRRDRSRTVRGRASADTCPTGSAPSIRTGWRYGCRRAPISRRRCTTRGEEVYDQSSWGVVLAKGPADASVRRAGGGQIVNFMFAIEPGNANYKVTASQPIKEDTYLTSMMPHMHVRGKSAKYTVKREDGSDVVALWVPNFDFNWQLNYVLDEPIFMPKGSTLETEFHYDNSPTNRFNPDPTQTVHWGDQTWEEMMLGYYGTVDPDTLDTTEGQQ